MCTSRRPFSILCDCEIESDEETRRKSENTYSNSIVSRQCEAAVMLQVQVDIHLLTSLLRGLSRVSFSLALSLSLSLSLSHEQFNERHHLSSEWRGLPKCFQLKRVEKKASFALQKQSHLSAL